MAQIGKLSAVEVAKAKGPAVLHDGGGLTSASRQTAKAAAVPRGSVPNRGYSGSNSTASAATWGLDPIPIFRWRRRVAALQSTGTSVATG